MRSTIAIAPSTVIVETTIITEKTVGSDMNDFRPFIIVPSATAFRTFAVVTAEQAFVVIE